MKTSQTVDILIPALMSVKTKLQAVTKSSNNPFFKSKYADLNTYLDEVEPLLAENKLLLLQPVTVDMVTGANVVSSVIMHENGQFISSEMSISGQTLDAQKMGAAVTYFRRYTLASLLAMKAEDDDGNTASGKTTTKSPTATLVAAVNQTSTTPSTVVDRPSFRRPKTNVVSTQEPTSNGDDI